MNKVTLFGNLGSDPELRVTQGGQAVLKLSVATNETFLDSKGTQQTRTEWHRVTVWGRRAEALAKLLRKGEKVLIEGELRTSKYEKNGETHYSTEVHAIQVELTGAGKRDEGTRRTSSDTAGGAHDEYPPGL